MPTWGLGTKYCIVGGDLRTPLPKRCVSRCRGGVGCPIPATSRCDGFSWNLHICVPYPPVPLRRTVMRRGFGLGMVAEQVLVWGAFERTIHPTQFDFKLYLFQECLPTRVWALLFELLVNVGLIQSSKCLLINGEGVSLVCTWSPSRTSR